MGATLSLQGFEAAGGWKKQWPAASATQTVTTGKLTTVRRGPARGPSSLASPGSAFVEYRDDGMGSLKRSYRLMAGCTGIIFFAGMFICNVLHFSTTLSDLTGSAKGPLSLMNKSRQQQLRNTLEAYSSARRHGGGAKRKRLTGQEEGLIMEFPVAVRFLEDDMEMDFCMLDYGAYQANPEKYPMFTDLERVFCRKGDRYSKKLSSMLKDRDTVTSIPPTAFIFHESRVGSTLLANLLATAPGHLVYSEPHLPFLALKACRTCSEERMIQLLQDVMWVMGRTTRHDHLFVKFQSALVPYMETIIKAFPDTPFIFLFREPVEVMVSNFRRGPAGPCVRGKKNPPEEVQEVLGTDRLGAMEVPDEDYCAAHLESICRKAIELLEKYPERGRAVDYQDLPHLFLDTLLPGHFRVALSESERAEMDRLSTVYSKSRQGAVDFKGDSEAKQEMASPEVTRVAHKYLTKSFQKLHSLSQRSLEDIEHVAQLKQQESMVYTRTGSKFFGLPHCPDKPEMPPTHKVVDLLENWNPDDPSIPARHYNTLCRLDYQKDYDKALAYRDAEVPFIVYNIPDLEKTSSKWSTPGYLERRLQQKKYHVEISKNNHFMYYRQPSKSRNPNFRRPTEPDHWTYEQWLAKAQAVGNNVSAEEEHYYFRVSDPDADFIREDMTIFRAVPGLFLKEPNEQRGIHCRFGMKGVIAEAHFDSSRNMVALLYGSRRWILAHPHECHNCYLLPPKHPSGRHSEVDWSKPDVKQYPLFDRMQGHEVILTPGDLLYVPAYWIHYIVNLDINCQCNTRSGDSLAGLQDVIDCGFTSFKNLMDELKARAIEDKEEKEKWGSR